MQRQRQAAVMEAERSRVELQRAAVAERQAEEQRLREAEERRAAEARAKLLMDAKVNATKSKPARISMRL